MEVRSGSTRRRPSLKRILQQQLVAIGVLLGGLVLSLLLAWQLARTIESKDRDRFLHSVERLQDAIERRLATYTDMLHAAAGTMDGQRTFNRARFRAFVDRLDLQGRYPGIQGLGFSARIAREDVALFAQIQQAEFPEFEIKPPDPRREYHLIVELQPLDERNRAAIGYDMFTDPTRRVAMERARDTGLPSASGPVFLVQEIEPNDKQPGFLIYLAVYEGGGVPPTVQDRRARLAGFVYSPFRVGDLFAGILDAEEHPRAGFELVDVADPSVVLFRTDPREDPHFVSDRLLDVAGREWRVSFFSLPGLALASSRGLVPLAGWLGVAVSLVVATLVWKETAARRRLERAERRARDHAFAMERARAEAERVNQLKDDFLATLSHELRTPLNAMLGWLQVLERGGVPEERRREVLATVSRNAEIQSRLIDDLLDMNRIIAGRLRIERTEIRLQEIIDESVGILRSAADAKNVTITTACDPVPPLLADGNRLRQVLWNLLSNAVKFTPPGGRVILTLRGAGTLAEIEVKDNGAGIPQDFLPYVFDPFRQGEIPGARAHGGLGLGLSIVKNLVELHGGTIQAESAGPGQGATFRVRLPMSLPTARVV